MKRGINLKLPQKKTSELGKKTVVITTVLFLVTLVIGISLVGYNLYLKSSLDRLEEERKGLLSQIVSQNTKLYKLNDTHNRLKNIQSIVNGRLKAIDKVDIVAGILPEDSKVRSIDTKILEVNYVISNPDLGKLNTLLEEKVLELAAQKDKKVKRIELKSLALDPDDRTYILNFKVAF